MQIVTRKEAVSRGLKTYYTGKLCKNGHRAKRSVKYKDCYTCNQERNRVRCDLSRMKKRDANLKARYSISLLDYQNLLNKQENRCALCRNLEKELVVDHDHKTKAVRGLLCQRCNTLIGQAEDNPHVLQCAIDYLLKTT